MTRQLRTETDTLGTVTVPATAYYGAQTTRAINNFPISGQAISRFPDLIKSLAYIKWSAAKVNMRLGLLDRKKGEIIVRFVTKSSGAIISTSFLLILYKGEPAPPQT